MLDEYLNKLVIVRLVTGETLPDGVRFYGTSSFSTEMLWFVIPRASAPTESEKEFHVPITAIAVLELAR